MGAFALGMVATYLFDMPINLGVLALVALVVLGVGMLGSMLHLGRPARFLQTFSNIRSHLAQEGLLVFVIALLYIAVGIDGILVSYSLGVQISLRILALLASLVFIVVTALAYHMPARPAWKSYAVPITFLLTWLSIGSTSVLVWASFSGIIISPGFLYLACTLLVIALLGQAYYVYYVGRLGYKIDVRPLSEEFKKVFISWLIIGAFVPLLVMSAIVFVGPQVGLTAFFFLDSAVGLCIWQAFFFMCGKEIWYFPAYDKNMSPNYF
jgi:DMSO reductase anchor subunit